MFDRTIAVATGALAALLLAACASAPEQSADAPEQKYYRTGSNIPVRDYGAANIEVGKPDVSDSVSRPGTSVLGRKPGN
jgi:ABC-type oligopeptide transport system substrate-binding subunit